MPDPTELSALRVCCRYTPPSGEGPVVGIQAAVDGLLHGIDRHARVRCDVFGTPAQLPGIRARLALDQGRTGRRAVGIHDLHTLRVPDEGKRIDAWHDLAIDLRPFALRRALKGRYPITLTHHTLSYRELLRDVFLRLLLEGPRPTDAIVCSSSAARTAVERILEHVAARLNASLGTDVRYGGRLASIPLGIDTERFCLRDRAEARVRLGLGDDLRDAFLLLWVGRFSATDKADLVPLIGVVGELARANPTRNVLLVCVGSDRTEEQFSKVLRAYADKIGAGPHVLVRDGVADDLLPWAYAAADVFVSPVDSVQESYGLAPVEAMACGIPQVVSDWDGYKDTVVDGETGFSIPTTWANCDADLVAEAPFHDTAFDHLAMGQSVAVDLAALRDRLQRLIDDGALRARMREASRERAVRTFAIERVVSAHEDLWAELAAAAKEDEDEGNATEHAVARPALDLDAMPYCKVFGHYATRMLRPGDAVGSTSLAHELVAGTATLATHVKTPGIHSQRLIELIVSVVLSLEQAGRVTRAGGIVDVCVKQGNVSPAMVVREVLWLLKYGVLRLVS